MSFLRIDQAGNVVSTKPENWQPAERSNGDSSSAPVFKFSGNRDKFQTADPYLRHMMNYGENQQEYWTMAFGEPEVVRSKYGDNEGFVEAKTWQTDRGPVTVETFYDSDGTKISMAYNIGLADGSIARYNNNGELIGTKYPDGSFKECSYFDDDAYYN